MWQKSALKLKETTVKVDVWQLVDISPATLSVAANQLYIKSSVFFLFFYMVTSFALQAVINAKNGAVNFLANKVEAMTSGMADAYTLAITAYALSLVGSAKKVKALVELRKLATEKGEATCK